MKNQFVPDSLKLNTQESNELAKIRTDAIARHERSRKAAKARGRHDFPLQPTECSWAFEEEFRKMTRSGKTYRIDGVWV